jgi:hypothetical protein
MNNASVPADDQFTTAVIRVSAAIRKLASAASGQFGSDCYLHMQLGQVLLADLGFDTQPVVGFAAWRVGEGDGDVIAHVPHSPLPLNIDGREFPYHAWLTRDEIIVDLTTYQLKHKAQQLDASDGGHTTVSWSPDFLLLPQKENKTFKEVSAAVHPGAAYYDPRPVLTGILQPQGGLDPEDVAMARLLIANPSLRVFGPNDR